MHRTFVPDSILQWQLKGIEMRKFNITLIWSLIALVLGFFAGVASVFLTIAWIPEKSNWANVYASLFGGMATLLACLIALFWPSVQRMYYSNRLQLRLRSNTTFVEDISNTPHRYIHLEVSNNHIQFPVQNVRVLIRRVEYPGRNPPKEDYKTGPIRLLWQFEKVDNTPAVRIVGQMHVCDLASLNTNEKRIKLETAHDVASLERYLSENESMTIHLYAEGDDVTSDLLKVKIEWNGQWDDNDGTMAKHLKITDVTKQSTFIRSSCSLWNFFRNQSGHS